MEEINVKDVCTELTIAFRTLNELLFQNKLVEPRIVTQPRKRPNVNGWLTVDKPWVNTDTGKAYYEITISSQSFNESINDVLGILVHEMVHLSNAMEGIVDCARNQYHNIAFKEAAEAALLICEKIPHYGYMFTQPSERLIKIFDLLPIHDDVFHLEYRNTVVKSKTMQYKMNCYVCDKCGIKFKTRANLALDAKCGDCNGSINKCNKE
ncbi:MAG: SprT-like domain-containing protein [Firmicutes bacterium]|nr:SprT-like domain-containing protein [Bacillota bacterium]MCL1953673.1 SprT-like domain-containing protein [Bacillota bacterium]